VGKKEGSLNKNVNLLLENLLKIKATDHRKIQEEIKRNLEGLGYEVKLI